MNYVRIILFYTLLYPLIGLCAPTDMRICPIITTPENELTQDTDVVAIETPKNLPAVKKKRPSHKIPINYQNEDLTDIINQLAGYNGFNIIFPLTPLNTRITWSLPGLHRVDQAWDLLFTFMDIAGYNLVPRGPRTYSVVKTTRDIGREPLPEYIGVPYDQIPNTDERIRYLYFLNHIKLSDDNEIGGILRNLLPTETGMSLEVAAANKPVLGVQFRVDQATNTILIVDKASNIRGVMKIIMALDQPGFDEKLYFYYPKNVSARLIEDLFAKIMSKTEDPTARFNTSSRKPKEGMTFSRNVRVIAEPRTNAVLIMGRSNSVEKVKSFIRQYIDIEIDTGTSILHVYHLKNLNARQFKPILEQIIRSGRQGGTGQSQQGADQGIGPERFFDEVLIATDETEAPLARQAGETSLNSVNARAGGNKLIIAARSDDWLRIKELIQRLDIPQPQVILEVLIADLLIDEIRQLGFQIRNPSQVPIFGDNVSFQSANLGRVILDSATNPTTIDSDLLGRTIPTDRTLINSFPVGSTAVSFNDPDTGATWAVGQLLDRIDYRRIISNPHTIVLNNQEADVTVGEQRLVQGGASGNFPGTTSINRENLDAFIRLRVVPRISSSQTINLAVEITANNFTSVTDNTIEERIVRTNANVRNGSILVLGGLTRTSTAETVVGTPILSKIPFFGWLFKARQQEQIKTNLTIFISPIIIMPDNFAMAQGYTCDYAQMADAYLQEGLVFEGLRDPITRWFFRNAIEDPSAPLINLCPEVLEGRAKRQAALEPPPCPPLPEELECVRPPIDQSCPDDFEYRVAHMDNPFTVDEQNHTEK
ncbi:hypothetical protein J120_00235 [candidate division TM6 bacterium JCVI TM6SC1]|uniref:Uncharacterized protein n=1 Tax=candidate division TM6 bacterium JCVI TM6SC1 TaxID=1306947 RepID=A0A0D2JEA6_9BACT|nr:hypothetical protein J120_00235 [candidate division TM6 bacterium JCVI TM6SC1]